MSMMEFLQQYWFLLLITAIGAGLVYRAGKIRETQLKRVARKTNHGERNE